METDCENIIKRKSLLCGVAHEKNAYIQNIRTYRLNILSYIQSKFKFREATESESLIAVQIRMCKAVIPNVLFAIKLFINCAVYLRNVLHYIKYQKIMMGKGFVPVFAEYRRYLCQILR